MFSCCSAWLSLLLPAFSSCGALGARLPETSAFPCPADRPLARLSRLRIVPSAQTRFVRFRLMQSFRSWWIVVLRSVGARLRGVKSNLAVDAEVLPLTSYASLHLFIHFKLDMSSSITLNTGAAQPKVGFGLWKVPKESAAQAVYDALKTGYRLLDGAADYGNEQEAGQGLARAIKEGIVTREEVFVTSKLWVSLRRRCAACSTAGGR